MKKLVLSIIAVLLLAVPAFAGTAEDEAAVAKVLETFAAKAAVKDAHGMADLFTEDAVMNYFWGTINEPKKAEGRMKIYIVFSAGNVTSHKVEDVKITKTEGDLAEATGLVIVRASGFGMNFRRESEVTWQLKRINGSWLIYLYDFKLAPMMKD